MPLAEVGNILAPELDVRFPDEKLRSQEASLFSFVVLVVYRHG
jgi:hypothetical protein